MRSSEGRGRPKELRRRHDRPLAAPSPGRVARHVTIVAILPPPRTRPLPRDRMRRACTRPGSGSRTERKSVAVDIAEVSKLEAQPGELPEKMAAWVIRAEREGEPMTAFQLEEIELPEPGAFEV